MAMEASSAILRPERDFRGDIRIHSGASSDKSLLRFLIPMLSVQVMQCCGGIGEWIEGGYGGIGGNRVRV